MQIKIKKLSPKATLPEYAHGPQEDAGLDVRCIEDAVLVPNVALAVATGLAFEIPPGYEVQLRPRSGLALKYAITLANSPATIDPGYRKLPYEIHAGDRVAQMIVSRYEAVTWDESDLGDSTRGTGGFGSSGR
jgi:dUTP pyrophosphatase